MSLITQSVTKRKLFVPPSPAHSRGLSWSTLVTGVILGAMTLQIVFLLVGCDWDLAGDEAEYWSWSRRLDLSYFTRGPLSAWLIRLSTELARLVSPGSTTDTMFAIRISSILLGGLTAWGVYRLALELFARPRAAAIAVFLMPVIPALMVGAILATSDTPLVCAWTWATLWAYRAWRDNRPGAWIFTGFLVAIGILAKYTMLALPAAIGLFLLLDRSRRSALLRPGFWLMCTIGVVLGLAPIVIWNAMNHWVAFAQLADRLGFAEHSVWGSIGPLISFLGGEILALGIAWWFLALLAIVSSIKLVMRGQQKNADAPLASASQSPQIVYLLCIWAVVWAACLGASVLGESELNWMVPGYIPLLILMGLKGERILAHGGGNARGWVAAWCVSLGVIVVLHHTEWTFPLLARVIPAPTKRWPAPLRLVDPTCRMRGHKELARVIDQKLAQLRARGENPFVLTTTYALTATLEFQLAGQPETYCLGWNYGMTPDPVCQHDLWRPNPRLDYEAFKGRVGILIDDANMPPSFSNQMVKKGVFASMESIERLAVEENGLVVGAWDIAICNDYRGLANYKQNPWPNAN